jgi:hypothetical protein
VGFFFVFFLCVCGFFVVVVVVSLFGFKLSGNVSNMIPAWGCSRF